MKNIKLIVLYLTLLNFTSISTALGDGKLYTGHVYALGDATHAELYHYDRVVTATDATIHNRHTTYTPSGDIAVIQDAELQTADSPLLESFTMDHRQLGIVSSLKVERHDDRQIVIYDLQKGDQLRSKTTSFDKNAILTVGPTLYDTIWRYWETLTDGKTIKIRFLVVEQQLDVEFELSAASTNDEVTVRMRPSNFLMRWLVDDVNFVFDHASRRVRSMEGRVPPMQKKGDRWGDLDASVVYDYR